jgi:hypothetical protein
LKHGFSEFAATSHGIPYEYKIVADTNSGCRLLGDPGSNIFKGQHQISLASGQALKQT